jgi:hypothetical protein
VTPAAVPADELEAVFGDVGHGPLTVEPLPHSAVASATAGLWRIGIADHFSERKHERETARV